MRKILTAFIEQVIQFDNEWEYKNYITALSTGRPQKFKVMDEKQDGTGKVILRIRKQYNNNTFPDD